MEKLAIGIVAFMLFLILATLTWALGIKLMGAGWLFLLFAGAAYIVRKVNQ